jgi:hypothetical protein
MGDTAGISAGDNRSPQQQQPHNQTSAHPSGQAVEGNQSRQTPQATPAAGFWSGTVQRLRSPEKSPPSPPVGAAALQPAFTLQTPVPLRDLPLPLQVGGAHHAVAPGSSKPAPPQAAAAPALSDADRAVVDAWLSRNESPTGSKVYDALRDLSEPAQWYLLDRAFHLDKQGSRNLIDFAGLCDLVRRTSNDDRLHRVIAGRLVDLAVQLHQCPEGDGSLDDPRYQARACVLLALDALRGDADGLARLVCGLQGKAAQFAQVLDGGNGLDRGAMAEARSQVLAAINLAAMNGAPDTEATSAVVQMLFAETSPEDADINPRLIHDMALALAREWHPDDAGKAATEARRLEGLTEEPHRAKGIQMLFGGTLERRVAVLAAVRQNPVIDTHTPGLFDGDPTKYPAITYVMASMLVSSMMPKAANRDVLTDHLSKVLQTSQGEQLIFGLPGDNIPPGAKIDALYAILTNPKITVESLQEVRDAWTGEVAHIIGQANATDFRNDEPQEMVGTDLENMAGIAMHMPTTVPKYIPEEMITAQLEAHKLSLFTQDSVQNVTEALRKVGGPNPRVTVLTITYSSGATGPVQLPLFRVQTPQRFAMVPTKVGAAIVMTRVLVGGDEDQFVDNLGNIYPGVKDESGYKHSAFEDWIAHNKLPPGLVTYPDGGHLKLSRDGKPNVNSHETHNSGHKTEKMVDKLALVGGIVAGGAVILGTGGAVIGLLGAGSALWGSYRGLGEIREYLRLGHSPTDVHALGLYLNLAANATGIAAFASEVKLARLIAKGGTLSEGTALAIGSIRVAATLTNAEAFIQQGVALAMNWGSLTPEERTHALLQFIFWATVTGTGARQARHVGELVSPIQAARAILDAYQPPVIADSALPGNKVEIRTDKLGRDVIYKGPGADNKLVDLHVLIVRLMARERGLSGIIRQMLGEPAKGTLAFTLKYEEIKLMKHLGELRARLAGPLKEGQVEDIEYAIKIVQDQLAWVGARRALHRRRLDSPGEPIASPNTERPEGAASPEPATASPISEENLEALRQKAFEAGEEVIQLESTGVRAPAARAKYEAASKAFNDAARKLLASRNERATPANEGKPQGDLTTASASSTNTNADPSIRRRECVQRILNALEALDKNADRRHSPIREALLEELYVAREEYEALPGTNFYEVIQRFHDASNALAKAVADGNLAEIKRCEYELAVAKDEYDAGSNQTRRPSPPTASEIEQKNLEQKQKHLDELLKEVNRLDHELHFRKISPAEELALLARYEAACEAFDEANGRATTGIENSGGPPKPAGAAAPSPDSALPSQPYKEVSSAGPSKNGNKIDGIARTFAPSAEQIAICDARGGTPITFHELRGIAGVNSFRRALGFAKANNPKSGTVFLREQSFYMAKDMKLYLSEDGQTGFGIKDGEIVSVFRNPDPRVKKVMESVMALAVQQGGDHLDCADTVLPDMYAKFGFKAVARVRFDTVKRSDEKRPYLEFWDPRQYMGYNHGEPDWVWMVRDPTATAAGYKSGEGVRYYTVRDAIQAQEAAVHAIRARDARTKSAH